MYHNLHISGIFRRCSTILMLCWGICCWVQEAKGQYFAGGSGTSANPYLISEPVHLANLATLVNAGNAAYNNKCYKLMNDIDLSEYGSNWNLGRGWIPIGSYMVSNDFQGEFDGNNKKITGLYINDTNAYLIGLFGVISSAKIHNLGVEDVYIRGGENAGGIVGRTYNPSVITDCYVTGTVSGSSWVGGIAGYLTFGSITNCYFIGTANGGDYDYVGGIVGSNDGDITNCYSIGVVSGRSGVGGIAGAGKEKGGNVINCYSMSEVSGSSSVGGIVGRSSNMTNCAALNPNVTGNSSVGRVIGEYGTILSGNIAFCGMTNGGGAAFEGENTHDGLGGESRSHFDLLTATGFPPGFTTAPWTYVPGKLPGLFGKAVEMPEHLHTLITTPVSFDVQHGQDIPLNNNSITIIPDRFVTNVSQDNLTFRFVVGGFDRTSLTYSCDDIGSRTASIIAIEGECNRSQPQAVSFTISDKTSPTFDVIPNREVVLNNNSITVEPADFVVNGSVLDNCSNRSEIIFRFVVGGVDRASLTYSCNNIGSQTASIVAIDASGNRSQPQAATFSISDKTPPTFDVIPNREVVLDNNSITVEPADFVLNGSVSDNCSNMSEIIFRFVVGGVDRASLTYSCGDIGSNTVQIVAIDAGGNRSQLKTVIFTISDKTPPTFDIIPNREVVLNNNNITVEPADFILNGSVLDNCSNRSEIIFRFVVGGVDRANLTYSCGDIGSNTVQIVAIDAGGNRSLLKTVIFTISDKTPPTFDIIPNREVVLNNNSITVEPADFVVSGSVSDNCSNRSEIIFRFVVGGVDRANLMFSCNDIGSQTVSIVAIDTHGNRSQPKDVTFTVCDRTPPVFDIVPNQNVALDANGSISVNPADFVTNVSDNCTDEKDITFRFIVGGVDRTSLTYSCANIGSNTVSIVAIDASGNRSQPKTVIFVISEQTPPIARCKPATLHLDGDGKASLPATMIDNKSADNCGIATRQIKRTSDDDDLYALSLDFDRNDLETSDDGNISVTLRVSDASGNEATCTSEIRLIDLTPPSKFDDIPGIFTPNGDGFNDTWEIQEIDQYPEASIRIYNRAKKLIVELKGAQMPWDGRDRNGNLLESGYYFYQIELRRGGKIISGYVTILK